MASQQFVLDTTSDGVRMKVYHTPKLRENPLLEMASEVARGEMIGNEEVERTLERSKEAISEISSTALSSHGQLLARDLEELISSCERWLREKNPHQLLQHVFMESLHLGPSTVEESAATKELYELYDSLRRLTYVLVRSGDFRHVVGDFLELLKIGLSETQRNLKEEEEEGGEETEKRETEESIVDRTVRILSVIGNKQEYRTAVDDFILVLSELKSSWDSSKKYDVHRRKALDRAAEFLEGFAGHAELEAFQKTLWSLWDDVTHDDSFLSWLAQIREFAKNALEESPTMGTEEKKMELKKLIDRGKELVRQDIYKSKTDRLVERGKVIVQNIQEDPATLDMREKFSKFWRDFAFDTQGYPDVWVMEASCGEMKSILLPMMKKHVENLQIDKVEFDSDAWEGRLEDVVFSGANLLPRDIEFVCKSKTKIALHDNGQMGTALSFHLKISQLQPKVNNVKFYYRRKLFPYIEDHGVFDLDFPRNGINLFAKFSMSLSTLQPLIVNLNEVICSIGDIEIRIHDNQTKHHIIDKVVTRIWAKNIKRNLAKTIATAVASSLKKFERSVNDFSSSRPTDSLKGNLNVWLKRSYGGKEAAQEAIKQAQYRARAAPPKFPVAETIQSQAEPPVIAV